MQNKSIEISFENGARSVTGSNFLITIGDKKFLVDCGLGQGSKEKDIENHDSFKYNPNDVDALFVTHGHLDHVGRIGKLVKDGFRGRIYSTPPTKDIGELVMVDSMKIVNRNALEQGLEELYTQEHVDQALAHWDTHNYHEHIHFKTTLGDVTVEFRDAGHILGSAMIVFTVNGKKIAFTGDLGNTPSVLLADTEVMDDIDYLAIESVYGDRNHELHFERKEKLRTIMERTIKEQGVLIIPAFSVERTQELLFEMDDLFEEHKLSRVPVYLDSPLAIKVTEAFKRHRHYLNKSAQEQMKTDDIFSFANLHETRDAEESKAIKEAPAPKIIIAGAGMMNGGRILHHAHNYLGNEKATLLIIGYQAPGTLGRLIADGIKMVRMYGEEVRIHARIEKISGYSAHKDSDHLVEFVGSMAPRLKKVFVILGELKSSAFLAQRLVDEYNLDVSVPEQGDIVVIPLE